MMFEKGIELEAVWWHNCTLGYSIVTPEDTEFFAKSITIEMVTGHMANIPWAKVILEDGTVKMLNLSEMEEVIFKEKEEGPF